MSARRVATAVLATAVWAALPGTPASAADPAPRPITLEQALTTARKQAPSMIRAQGAVRSSRAQVRSAFGSFLPSLTLSASTARQFPSGGGGTRIENGQIVTLPSTPWSYGASVGAGLELFSGGRRLFDLRQARSSLVAAEAGAWAQGYSLDLDVKSSYFDVLAARESEAAATAQLAQAEQQRRAAVAQLRAARATKSDSLRAEIQVSNAQLALLQARQDIATAEAALTRAIGSTDAVTATPDGLPSDVARPLDEAELTRLALEGPAVAEARAQRDAAQAARRSAWTDYVPSLTASYSRGGNGSGTDAFYGPNDLGYNGSLRFSLSLPVFDRFSREAQGVAAAVALENAQAGVHDAELAAREALTRNLGTLRTAEERERVQTTSVAAAEEDLRAQQRRYELGDSTLLDVLTSQTQLDQARQSLIRARYDRRVALAQLESLAGRSLTGASQP